MADDAAFIESIIRGDPTGPYADHLRSQGQEAFAAFLERLDDVLAARLRAARLLLWSPGPLQEDIDDMVGYVLQRHLTIVGNRESSGITIQLRYDHVEIISTFIPNPQGPQG